jgi:hypothetical protein
MRIDASLAKLFRQVTCWYGTQLPSLGHNAPSSSHQKCRGQWLYGRFLSSLAHCQQSLQVEHGKEFACRHRLAVVSVATPVMPDRLSDGGMRRRAYRA